MALRDKEWLNRLDKVRLDQPKRVIHAIEKSMGEVERALIPWTYLVYGSALRQTSRLREAYHAYHDGLQLARAVRDLPAQAELTRRMGIVASAHGDFRLALSISKDAICLYFRCQDLSGAGKSVTEQAMYFYHLDAFEDSLSACEAALTYLNPSEREYSFTAWLGKALCHREIGNRLWAAASFQKADEIAQEVGPVLASKAKWYLGCFYLDYGEYSSAEEIFGELIDLYLETGNTLDAVLAGVHQARSLLELGRTLEATELALALNVHVIALPEDGAAAAGLVEIWHLASKRMLNIAVLKELAKSIERERGEAPHPLKAF